MGFTSVGVRAFAVTHKDFVGRTLSQLAENFPEVPILRLVRDGNVLDMTKDPAEQKDDIVTVRADVEDLIGREIKLIGLESDNPLAANVPIEVADVHVSHKISGIPFAFGTSAGVIMAGVGVSYFRSRNPNFGGPVHEGAR